MDFEDFYVSIRSQEEDEEVRHVLQEMGYRWRSGDKLMHLSYWKGYAMEGGYVLHMHPGGEVSKGGLWLSDSKKNALTAQDLLAPLCGEESLTGLTDLL